MEKRIPTFITRQLEQQYPSSGALLTMVIKKRKINRAALARLMQRKYNTVSIYLKNGSIQTSILWEMSLILKHNFFADFAVQLPADFACTNNDAMDARDAEIASLKQAVAKLQGEKDLLMEVMRK